MKIICSPRHAEHAPTAIIDGGRIIPANETPDRIESVLTAITRRELGPIVAPQRFGIETVARVHRHDFLEFMATAHGQWQRRYGSDSALATPSVWPGSESTKKTFKDIEALLGTFCTDTVTPIAAGTWSAARVAADSALSAARAVFEGQPAAFALVRPPGHHAGTSWYGGYCYLNNVAIAAQWFVDQGLRPAILDLDCHHGNGTQEIFYRRADVFFCSIHADPLETYPYFTGFAQEQGEVDGQGFTQNYPLPIGTDWNLYAEVLELATRAVVAYRPDILLISLGLDTYVDDPEALFRLNQDDYRVMGDMLEKLGLPTVFCFEGGYNIGMLGELTANVLENFSAR